MRVLALAMLLFATLSSAAVAQPAQPAPAVTAPTEIDLLIRLLEDDTARARLIQELRNGAPPAAAMVPAPAQTAPAVETPTAGPTNGAGMIAVFSVGLASIGDRLAEIVANMGNPAGMLAWLGEQALPRQRGIWVSLVAYLAGVVTPALLVWWVARRLLRPLIARLQTRDSGIWWRRIPFAFVHLALLLVPILLFVGVGYSMLTVLRPPTDMRLLLITTLLTAVGIALTCNAVAKTLLSPLGPALRPSPLSNDSAAYLYVWVRRLVDLAVYGYFLTQATLLVGVPPGAYAFLVRLIGLLMALLVAVLILQNRLPVQRWLASLGGDRVRFATARVLRERLAASWHVLALLYVGATWAVWMLGIPGGFTLIARNTLATAAIVVLTWFLIRLVQRVVQGAFGVSREIRRQYPFVAARADLYLPVAQRGVVILVEIVAALAVLQVWGIDILAWFASNTGREVLVRAVHIAVILAIATVALELSNAVVHIYLDAKTDDEDHVPSQRVRTLLPLIRNVLLIFVSSLAGLVILSELGVSIGPLLAGAGVAGVAIGFGAQTLVKDFITGLFILIEDSLHVGDVATLGGKTGVVEAMTIRTVRMRDTDGTVYTIPFSSVTMVENSTKDFSYAVIDVRVAYDQDYEHVVKVMNDIGKEMKADAKLGRSIIGAIEVMGIEEITDTALVIRARIKTRPQRQWDIRREFLRRVTVRFAHEGIELPFGLRPPPAPRLPPPPAKPLPPGEPNS